MPQFYTVLTETGQAKMANALALGTMIEITDLAVGDGGGALPQPDSDTVALVNEVRRAQVNRVDTDDDNPSWLIVEQVLPAEVGGWTIREVGLFDVDGDLIGYGNYPETYKPVLDEGSGRTLTIRMVLEVSDTAAVTLKIDPSVVLATREYVDDGDAAIKATMQFATYDAERTYTTGEVVRGSDGQFYEFYDRDQAGTVKGVLPTNSANRPHIWMRWDGARPGSTIEWRSETLPEGYVENDGAVISRADYRRVFSAFGTTYGAGDGATTFQLPDDRGEFKRGLDRGRGVDAGRGLAQHQMDAMQRITGAINAATSSSNIPLLSASTGAFTSTNPDPGLSGVSGGGADRFKTAEFDSANSPDARTDDSTYPRNNAVIWLTKI